MSIVDYVVYGIPLIIAKAASVGVKLPNAEDNPFPLPNIPLARPSNKDVQAMTIYTSRNDAQGDTDGIAPIRALHNTIDEFVEESVSTNTHQLIHSLYIKRSSYLPCMPGCVGFYVKC